MIQTRRDRPFSHLLFRLYASDLSDAVYAMSLDHLKQELAHIPGIETLTMSQGPNGTEIYTKGNETVTLPAGNAARRNRVQFLADQFQRQPMSETIVPAVTMQADTAPASNVTGIQSGAFKSKLAEMRQKIADKQTEALSKIDGAVSSGAAKMNAAVDEVISKADREVDAALHEFATFTNGGPA